MRIKRCEDVRESIGISASVGNRVPTSAHAVKPKSDDDVLPLEKNDFTRVFWRLHGKTRSEVLIAVSLISCLADCEYRQNEVGEWKTQVSAQRRIIVNDWDLHNTLKNANVL